MTNSDHSDHPLAGRVAIVTGAGRGAGEAMAHALAYAGACVCVSDLNPDRAERVASAITADGGEAFGFQADVSNKFQVASMIETTRDHYDGLHILAHHAHVNPAESFLTMDEWELRRTVEVNLVGSFLCMQLAARVMADEGGGLIAVPLRALETLGSGQSALAMTQMGMIGLLGVLEMELEQTGVRLESLALGDPQETADQLLSLCLVSR
jgi:NAD(P)-dependent dehydrogenase (short-subunit alcohol dehydrogenase family)